MEPVPSNVSQALSAATNTSFVDNMDSTVVAIALLAIGVLAITCTSSERTLLQQKEAGRTFALCVGCAIVVAFAGLITNH